MALNILLLSTPVAPLGSGLGGGVELLVCNLVQALLARGHRLTVVAPQGSHWDLPLPLVTLPGHCQPTAHTASRTAAVIQPEPSVLAAMWDYGRQVQGDYDLIVHFAYDWLPFYLTPFFSTPIAHFVSMGSLTEAMDATIAQVARTHPGTIGVATRTQAETFPGLTSFVPLGGGVDLGLYEFCGEPEAALAWVGRISPEKGIEDAIEAAIAAQLPLKILGKLENQAYWESLQTRYPDAPLTYLGFLPTADLQAQVRTCRALLVTPRWVEAFGNVAIEALACGVPVIAYDRGGPAEIVRDGETGWLVPPDRVEGLVAAISRLDRLDRRACRRQAEAEFSLPALGERFERWFYQILAKSP